MNKTTCLAIAGCFIAPQLLWAANPTGHQYIDKDKIELSPATKVAFDRSGNYAVSRTLTDGTGITELNGSMRSVTVARRGPSGKIETYCTTDQEAAMDWMAGLISPAAEKVVLPAQQVKQP